MLNPREISIIYWIVENCYWFYQTGFIWCFHQLFLNSRLPSYRSLPSDSGTSCWSCGLTPSLTMTQWRRRSCWMRTSRTTVSGQDTSLTLLMGPWWWTGWAGGTGASTPATWTTSSGNKTSWTISSNRGMLQGNTQDIFLPEKRVEKLTQKITELAHYRSFIPAKVAQIRVDPLNLMDILLIDLSHKYNQVIWTFPDFTRGYYDYTQKLLLP